jgi:fatty acid desaturase
MSCRTVQLTAEQTRSKANEQNDSNVVTKRSGLALTCKKYPTTKKEVTDVIPERCFKRDTIRALSYAFMSIFLTSICFVFGFHFIPLRATYIPVWILYSIVTGTVATGNWVIAHECGHGAFSDNKTLQTLIGYLLHTALLVPFFSWQRSHAVHHMNTNHMTHGETHVPYTMDTGRRTLAVRARLMRIFGDELGLAVFSYQRLILHLLFGWWAYLFVGITGGPVRGKTNHFWPHWPFSTGNNDTDLFPRVWRARVSRRTTHARN